MNTLRILLCAAVVTLSFGLIAPVDGAVEMFLKIEGIEGEVLDKDHQNWIQVESFSWGMSSSGRPTGGGGGGKAQFLDLAIAKRLDKASPNLFLHGAQGRSIPEVVLVLRRGGSEPFQFFKITLNDVLVSSSSVSGSSVEEWPSETLTLAYGKIKWSYTPQLPTGAPGQPIVTSWDLIANTPQ